MLCIKKVIVVFGLCISLTGCLGTIVGAAVDTTIEVAKVPFKVVGAAVDVVTDDYSDSGDKKNKRKKRKDD